MDVLFSQCMSFDVIVTNSFLLEGAFPQIMSLSSERKVKKRAHATRHYGQQANANIACSTWTLPHIVMALLIAFGDELIQLLGSITCLRVSHAKPSYFWTPLQNFLNRNVALFTSQLKLLFVSLHITHLWEQGTRTSIRSLDVCLAIIPIF